MTAVVFGATGLVGIELVKQLLDNRDYSNVIAVTRRQLSISDPKLEELIVDDFSTLPELEDKLKASVYFCCIGTTIATAGTQEAFRKVDLFIPQQIAGLAEALAIPALVVISSIGASAASSNFYLRTKGEMEKSVREIYSGNLKFIRPSFLMGKREENRLGEKVAIGFMKICGWMFVGPLRKYKGINVSDVAYAMIRISRLSTDRTIYESDQLDELKNK